MVKRLVTNFKDQIDINLQVEGKTCLHWVKKQ